MLVTNKLEESPSGGRELLCRLNHDALKEIYGDRLIVFELSKSSIRGLASLIDAFIGYIDGLSAETIADALSQIHDRNVEKIFVDGSNFGEFVRVVKAKFSNVRIYTFFHNVEARFFLGALKQFKTLRAVGVLAANYLAERKSVIFSDKIICMNERDSRLLERVYGRPATDLSPMSVQDKMTSIKSGSAKSNAEKFVLFVGGTFYANQSGIEWFVKNVAPRISIKTCIVGRGFEKLKDELELKGKVEVVGEVEYLEEWYLNSYFVIAPIFDGSGMKTKVAEALMFGKKIIGTPEAFAGYEDIADRAGRVCSSADDFVSAIDSACDIVESPFDKGLREIYEARYSLDAARDRLKLIMS
ncbi:MAG: glycosyltransferase family 1 protein [Nitrospirae bacterium]|nr:MAG: glycosyltransferase family 1 protein [Nitrospirota bacterium]